MARVIQDPVLGSLEWDDELHYWRSGLALPSGRWIQLDITPATDAHSNHPESPDVFTSAYPVVAWLRESEQQTYTAVSREMVEIYNHHWSEESPITAEEFSRRIDLTSVNIPSDGKDFTLFFNDGQMEMFGGHGIRACFGVDGQLRSASL
ncbi:MAG: DUF2262 domain-containing protein [Bacteroidales bacterium]|nr:DUF2262 domain-containing protein [Bacteroidales bacterium]